MSETHDTKQTAMHTPGPWDYSLDYIVAPDPNGRHPDIYIAEIAHSDDEGRIASLEQQDANRRLIAAAPELPQMLRDAEAFLQGIADNDKLDDMKRTIAKKIIKRHRAVIAKATLDRRSA